MALKAGGIDYLMAAQENDGLWYDHDRTGVVFPKTRYTAYHLVATCGALVSIHRALNTEFVDGHCRTL